MRNHATSHRLPVHYNDQARALVENIHVNSGRQVAIDFPGIAKLTSSFAAREPIEFTRLILDVDYYTGRSFFPSTGNFAVRGCVRRDTVKILGSEHVSLTVKSGVATYTAEQSHVSWIASGCDYSPYRSVTAWKVELNLRTNIAIYTTTTIS